MRYQLKQIYCRPWVLGGMSLELAPQSPGLLAVSLGLSRNFSDDHETLRHGMVMYDALYRWCREGKSETHAWNPETYR